MIFLSNYIRDTFLGNGLLSYWQDRFNGGWETVE